MTVEEKTRKGPRLPPWIRIRYSGRSSQDAVNQLVKSNNLHTVCQGAQCPNQPECFSRGVATFMILGDTCTRDCRFCAVQSGIPAAVDADEPRRLAEAVVGLNLRHVVVTSVTRDDLPDGGAGHFAATIRALRAAMAHVTVEVLTPDFKGVEGDIDTVLDAVPDVFNHNLETVRRLQKTIRPAAHYDRSLAVLARAAQRGGPKTLAKSGLMVGLGETDEEVVEAMTDLRRVGVELLTIGQYLAPSGAHAPVERFVTPGQFDEYARRGETMGFRNVASGPMVRSSYMAERQFHAKGGGRCG
ncbi:MAG: lipoyl synthase [bacterium]